MAQEDSRTTKPSEKGDSKKDAIPPEGSSKPKSDKNTPQSLKAKSKIRKKLQAGLVKAKTDDGFQQTRKRKRRRKNKNVVRNTDEPPKEKSLVAEKSKEEASKNKSTSDKGPIEKRHQAEKNRKVDSDKSEQKWKNKEKHRESDREARSKTDKANCSGLRITESSEKKREKPGGFIFMCSGKTKPDCFQYRVMGVPAGKKDIILGVKPGMKLFLYDFDLKLLYGIYKASSSGGMKLEPRAFGGNFPAQVRFSVDSDCFPLPESIFRKAIKENYDAKHRFKTELTVRQVRKLTELFRPAEIRSALQPVSSPPKAIIQNEEHPDGVKASSWSHLHRERAAGDPYTSGNMKGYNVLSHERDPRLEQREEIPRNLFLTEKMYQAYGLQGDGRNVASASQVNPILEPYKRDYEREHFHHMDPNFQESVPAHVESLRADPHHLNGSEYQTYYRADDLHHAYRYGALPRDPYLPTLSREDISSSLYGGRTLIGAENLQSRETVHNSQYSSYSAAEALSEYDRISRYNPDRLDATSAPVSSHYSFAGPSYSLR